MTNQDNAQKKCVFIVGMHRSGTSALTGTLKLMGVELGKELMQPWADNPKGFFENNKIWKYNQKILENFGSSWDDPFLYGENWTLKQDLSLFKPYIENLIEEEFSSTPLFAIKDPRMCVLFPLWQEICADKEIIPLCLLPFRHPMEVAQSLRKRNGFSIERGILLWINYVLTSESVTRGFPRVFVKFDDLCLNPKFQLDSISSRLGFTFPCIYENIKIDIESFLDRDLKHHSEIKLGGTRLEVMAKKLYLLFCQATEFVGRKESWDAEIENIRLDYGELNSFFLNSDLQKSYVSSKDSSNALRDIKQLQKENINLRQVQSLLEEELESSSSKNTLLEHKIEAMGDTKIWRLAEKLRRICGYRKQHISDCSREHDTAETPLNFIDITPDGGTSCRVQIFLSDTPNARSQGNEVWLLNIFDSNGHAAIDWAAEAVDPPLEIKKLDVNNKLSLLFRREGTIVFNLPPDSQLEFLSHPWSGVIDIEYEKKSINFDLYSPVGSKKVISVCDIIAKLEGKKWVWDVAEQKWLDRIKKQSPDVIAVINPHWRGVRSATENLVSTTLFLEDNLNELSADRFARLIQETGVTKILFGGFPLSYALLAKKVIQLQPDIKIFAFWLSSFLQSNEDYAWHSFLAMNRLCKEGVIDKIGFAKKGMAETLAKTGVSTGFIASYVREIPARPSIPKSSGPHIGIWALAPIWRKNPFAMLAATAMIENATVLVVGQNSRAKEFSKYLGINMVFQEEPIPQEKMPEALSQMHLNLYVTLSECSPMLPLESLAAGVPCLLGPTSHLFEDNPYLHSRLVVPYPDRSDVIAEMIERALNERVKIVQEYIQYAHIYNQYCEGRVAGFFK